MTSNEEPDSGRETDLQPIPEELQNISTEEIVEGDYEAVPARDAEDSEKSGQRHHRPAAYYPPGRNHCDDSVEASSDDPGGNPHKDAYSVGFDSPMATRIGDEGDGDDDAERLRELHEGRHHSDGSLSTRQSQWDKTRIAGAICSALPLAQLEREKVLSAVETLDFSRFGQQKGIERVTFGVIAVVVDEQHRQRDGIDGEIVSFTDEYREMCRSNDVAMSDLATIKEIVREAFNEADATIWRREPRRDTHLPKPTPDQYPREYWDEHNPEHWVHYAKTWPAAPDEFKEAIPDEYLDLIENLRQWEPWEDKEDCNGSDEEVELISEEPTDTDDVEELSDELEAEVEELVAEMRDESTE